MTMMADPPRVDADPHEIDRLMELPYVITQLHPFVEEEAWRHFHTKPEHTVWSRRALLGGEALAHTTFVYTSEPLTDMLLNKWVPDAVVSADEHDRLGVLRRTLPETAEIYKQSAGMHEIWVHARRMSDAQREAARLVHGNDKGAMNPGGIARLALVSLADDDYSRILTTNMVCFKEKRAEIGMPGVQRQPSVVEDFFDTNAHFDIEVESLATLPATERDPVTENNIEISSSLQHWIELSEEVVACIGDDANRYGLRLSPSKVRGFFLTSVVSGLSQLHELTIQEGTVLSPVITMKNDAMKALFEMLDVRKRAALMTHDHDLQVSALLLAGKFALLTAPTPIYGESWVRLLKLDKTSL